MFVWRWQECPVTSFIQGKLSFPNGLRTAFLWTFPVTTFKSVLPFDCLTAIYEGLAWHHKGNVTSERETLIPDNQRINIAVLHGMCILRKGKFLFTSAESIQILGFAGCGARFHFSCSVLTTDNPLLQI